MSNKKLLYPKDHLTPRQIAIREVCESDLAAFVRFVSGQLHLGHCHEDLLRWLTREDAGTHQLVLWPRAHMKSQMIAHWTAWAIINDPTITIIYASTPARLAYTQLYSIKNILTSDRVMKYWPGLIEPQEGMREQWRTDSIIVDHVARKESRIKDSTIKVAGIETGLTGAHCDYLVLDDLVVYENSKSPEERDKVKTWYSLASSVINPGGRVKAVGTRYSPDDLYGNFMKMRREKFNKDGVVLSSEPLFEVNEAVVETDGQFFWPRSQRKDGAWFGFDWNVLADKRAQYLDKSQFYGQYYNDPSDPENARVEANNFLYYNREDLRDVGTAWFHGDEELNVFASIDFASTVKSTSDYTAIVVVGVDSKKYIYILDIDRFRTNKISEMADRLFKLYSKWRWKKLRAEATAAQELVIEQIKEYQREYQTYFPIKSVKPLDKKEIRIMTNLEPRYNNGHIFHFRGGLCQILEDELVSSRPDHDDISDALAAVMEIIVPPISEGLIRQRMENNKVLYHPKWGGVA